MIRPPKNPSSHLASTWAAGMALLCLGIGLHGATAPLSPEITWAPKRDLGDDTVMVETFQPQDSAPAQELPEEPEPEVPEEDLEIPPLPEITPPLSPPEMVEITPLEQARDTPPAPKPPVVEEKKPEPPKPQPKPVARRKATATSNTSNSQQSGGGGTGSSPTLFTGGGGGGGRYPSPSYPASARSAKQQGTVRVLVTVEASGMPSSAEVTSSSGFPALDRSALDAIQRRWRWPSGPVRKYIVPVRFVLQ